MFLKRRPYVFGIGRNKTGTTSLDLALTQLGYRLPAYKRTIRFLDDWARRDFSALIKFCRGYTAFQDIPFSLEFTYVAMDQAFPGSKFILTVRNSAEEWFESTVRFRSKMLGLDRPATVEDMKNHAPPEDPARKGDLWRQARLLCPEEEFQVREAQIRRYETHNRMVKEYFRHRPESLLVLNPAEPDAMRRLCDFLEIPYRGQEMPHANRSSVEA